jgi:hypothetical protein
MTYKVVPFNAQIQVDEGAERAAAQLEGLVNQYEGDGWAFHGLETIDTVIVTPGTNGCLGLGAVPESRTNVSAYVAVFQRQ